jgi:hypothetical protein
VVRGLLILLLFGAGPASAGELIGYGPVPVRNFQPFQLLFLAMPGDRAAVIPKKQFDVRFELANTATIFSEQSARVDASVKFEQLRSGLFLRYGLTDRMEVGVEVPAYYRYYGFMDGPIKGVERATTGLSPARKALSQVGYAFRVRRDGQPLFENGDGHVGLGDITLSTKYQVLSEGPSIPSVSLRAALKLPTGDQSSLFGSGHPDFGLGLAVEKTLGSHVVLYGNVNGILPTGTVAGLALSPMVSVVTAAEVVWSDFSLIGQLDYYSSPYHNTGTRILDRAVTEGVIGVSYRVSQSLVWQIYAVENLDLVTGSAADFTLSTMLTYKFRR